VATRAKRLICNEAPGWPKLAWVAAIKLGSETVSLLHGPCVETRPDWCVEAVWAGDLEEGGFDLTDLVVGTGAWLRDENIVFVSSGDSLNRLHYFRNKETYMYELSACFMCSRRFGTCSRL
jgi:hypothetical protein